MPLNKSGSPEAFKENVKTLMGEVGQSPHVQSRSQALAIAYATNRRARAEGGPVHVGPIISTVPGRTDLHDMDVPSGAYVLPAECVSNLGENNTLAGLDKLRRVLGGTPEEIRKFFGSTLPKRRASGGRSGSDGSPVPIKAAGGEYVIPPDKVAIIGHGDVRYGHEVLDKFVMKKRPEHVKTLKGLAPPAKD